MANENLFRIYCADIHKIYAYIDIDTTTDINRNRQFINKNENKKKQRKAKRKILANLSKWFMEYYNIFAIKNIYECCMIAKSV